MIVKNKVFEKLVKEKYQQMLKEALFVDILDQKKFGQISVFVDKKPKFILLSFKFDTHQVWVGSNSI